MSQTPPGPRPPDPNRMNAPMPRPEQARSPRPATAGRREHPRRRGSALRFAAWTLTGVGLLLVVAIGLLVVFAPVGLIRDQLVREVKVQTGRDLVIAGTTSLSIIPSLAISMGDVSLSAPPGMGGPALVKMRRLDASASLMDLLGGKISVRSIVLTDPVFDLRVDAKGRQSWDFSAAVLPRKITYAQAVPQDRRTDGVHGSPELREFLRNSSPQGARTDNADKIADKPIGDLAVDEVRIQNATIRYHDARSSVSEQVDNINARLTAPSLSQPARVDGTFAVRGERIAFDGMLSTPKAVMDNRSAGITIAVRSAEGDRRFNGQFKGELAIRDGDVEVKGPLSFETPSIRALASLAGAQLPQTSGFNNAALNSHLKVHGKTITLDDAKLVIDDTNATGRIDLRLAKHRPRITANLNIDRLDLNRYIGESATANPGQASTPAGTSRQPGTRVRGYKAGNSWSDEPIDLSGLGHVDADANIRLGAMQIGAIKVGASSIKVALNDRMLRTTVNDSALYGGRGRGVLAVDGRGPSPSVGVNFVVANVSGLPFLRDAIGFDWVGGNANVRAALVGQGNSEKALMGSLQGDAGLDIKNGAIVGFNIAQLIRGASRGQVADLSRVPTAKTDFSQAKAAFTIKSGVATITEFSVLSPLLRIGGSGRIDIANKQLGTTFRPKLVGSLSGQGGPLDLTGIEIPVRVTGPWHDPQIIPDVSGVLNDPTRAVDAIKQFGKNLKKNGGAGLGGLLNQFLKR